MKKIALLLLSLPWTLAAQVDTSLMLRPERLLSKDIITHDSGLEKNTAISASRTPEDINQTPYTVWVITASDILLNGYVTLTDVLRAAPGIRVSQPGNAIEGETFMMRGLAGNQYVKILINDVPIKPSAALGMPIGAQLPIRQAERIEVYYGPNGVLYGDEACAGVVNIIVRETDRPIFTQADLSFGKYGYNSLDLTFGGRLGRDKNSFRFTLYGSSTVRSNTDQYYDPDLFDPSNYLPFGLDSSVFSRRQNYIPDFTYNTTQAKTSPLPHESRMFGLHLTGGGFHFTYHRMKRSDHTALGLSPLAVSYANSSTRLEERLETYNLGFQRNKRKRKSYHNLSLLRYNVDNTTTTSYLFDRLSAGVFQVFRDSFPSDSAALSYIYERYASRLRYGIASSIDFRYESRTNIAISPRLALDLGGQLQFSNAVPYLSHYSRPFEASPFLLSNTLEFPLEPYSPESVFEIIPTLFGQLTWRSKHLYASAGTSMTGPDPFALGPRLAVMYRIDSTWAVYSNYSAGYRRPNYFAMINSFEIRPDSLGGAFPGSETVNRMEKIESMELGIRFEKENLFRANTLFFYQKGYNLARDGYLYQTTSLYTGKDAWVYGYANAPGLALSQWGLQGIITWEDVEITQVGRRKKANVSWRGEFYAQYTRGKEWFGYGLEPTNDIRNMPRWMFQFRSSWRTGRLQTVIASNRQNGLLSKSVVYRNQYQRQYIQERFPKFRTWDFMLRYYLSNHFLVYFNMQNVFNKRYAGIDATGTPDDLLYNPQQRRLYRFGVNYNMN